MRPRERARGDRAVGVLVRGEPDERLAALARASLASEQRLAGHRLVADVRAAVAHGAVEDRDRQLDRARPAGASTARPGGETMSVAVCTEALQMLFSNGSLDTNVPSGSRPAAKPVHASIATQHAVVAVRPSTPR